MNIKGRSLELYFIDGRPDGMLTAEVFNWTGHVLMTPRIQISAALSRKEAQFTGVYLLLGEQDGDPKAYIGEGEDIGDRIRNHDSKKDWWSFAVLVTSAANNLNKAHVKYLEARLIEEARAIKHTSLENGTAPARPSLSESSQANMETFLDYLMMVFGALQIEMFTRKTRDNLHQPTSARAQKAQITFELSSQYTGVHATAVLQDGDFIVEKGSLARPSWLAKVQKARRMVDCMPSWSKPASLCLRATTAFSPQITPFRVQARLQQSLQGGQQTVRLNGR